MRDGNKEGGEYTPAGEAQGQSDTFSADQIAAAFDVSVDRIHRAMEGEFGLPADSRVDSRQAQHLAEVVIGDAPLDQRTSALMKLGSYAPRPDQSWGMGETAPGEESDRLAARADTPDDEIASERSSHDPAYRTR